MILIFFTIVVSVYSIKMLMIYNIQTTKLTFAKKKYLHKKNVFNIAWI